jgi:hypothetical protein
MNASETHSRTSIRRKGLLRFVIGLAVFAVGLTIPLFVLPYFDHQLTATGMIPFALPGAYALSGVIEFVTGVSFLEFARRWDELKGWQHRAISHDRSWQSDCVASMITPGTPITALQRTASPSLSFHR